MKENALLKSGFDYVPKEYSDQFWNQLRESAAKQRIPLHGHFELTPRCNFNCKMCYIHLNKNQMGEKQELSLTDWKKVIDQAIEAGMVFASLTGGECLLVDYFDDLYLYLKQKGILIYVLSNGYYLQEKLPLFIKHPPAHIQISVYGYDSESYKKVTGFDAYQKVQSSILAAKRNKLSISVAVTASVYLKSVYDIVRFYYEHEIGVTINKGLLTPFNGTGREKQSLNLSNEEKANVMQELCLATNTAIVPYKGNLPQPGGPKQQPQAGLTCSAGRTDFTITWKGEMTSCVSLPTALGIVTPNNFKDLWAKTVAFADSFVMPQECPGCTYSKICNKCPGFHLEYSKSGHCNPDACDESVLLVQRGLALLDQ